MLRENIVIHILHYSLSRVHQDVLVGLGGVGAVGQGGGAAIGLAVLASFGATRGELLVLFDLVTLPGVVEKASFESLGWIEVAPLRRISLLIL